jgi:hypothetical protein
MFGRHFDRDFWRIKLARQTFPGSTGNEVQAFALNNVIDNAALWLGIKVQNDSAYARVREVNEKAHWFGAEVKLSTLPPTAMAQLASCWTTKLVTGCFGLRQSTFSFNSWIPFAASD